MDIGANVETFRKPFEADVLPLFAPVTAKGLRSGDHAALIYETTAEKFAHLAEYFNEGAEQGDKMIFYTWEQNREDALHLLESYKLDVEKLLSTGALAVKDSSAAFYPGGVFDVDLAISERRKAVMEGLSKGFNVVRVAADMGWALGRVKGAEMLMEFEARFNYFARALDSITLCGFNQGVFPREVVFNAMQTHPVVVKKGVRGVNPYYLDPSVFLGSESAQITRKALARLAGERHDKKTVERVRAEFNAGLKNFGLSPQEQRVAEMVLVFKSNQEISDEFGISVNTVKQHVKNIYRKLRINKRIELIARFMKLLEEE